MIDARAVRLGPEQSGDECIGCECLANAAVHAAYGLHYIVGDGYFENGVGFEQFDGVYLVLVAEAAPLGVGDASRCGIGRKSAIAAPSASSPSAAATA